MIELIGAPFDLCGRRLGSRMGPTAIRLAGLRDALEELGLSVQDSGDLSVPLEEASGFGLRNLAPLLALVKQLRYQTMTALSAGRTPVIIGGEHTVSIGSVSAALETYSGDLAVLWIDAHADINTPGSTASGNLHGMPLAALAGMPSGDHGQRDADWKDLLAALGNGVGLEPSRMLWFGLRDVDAAERERLSGCAVTMHDIDRYGVATQVARLDGWLRESGASRLWVSFDVDAMDPLLAPGTGTGVRGGLTYREAHLTAELIRECLEAEDCPYRLAGVDLVETNPLFDTQNKTAKMAVEWLASLFGKTILGRG